MALEFHGIFRTSRVVKEENVQRTGRNGVFESKYVMFQGASDRPYKQAVSHQDGTVTQERQPDFFTFKMSGGLYDTWKKYCDSKKIVDGKEKLVSRRLYLAGHAETYNATRKEIVQANVNGQLIQIAVELPETRTIYVVEKFEFLDANPINKENTVANGTVATAVPTVAPAQPVVMPTVAPAQTATIAQPAQPMIAQPVAMPVAPVAQTVAQPQTIAQPTVAPVAQYSEEVAPF
jgi:hypothetical protein